MTALIASLLAATYMAGLSWFVGSVHYPLFARVAGDGWAAYHEEHSARTTRVVVVPMVVELVAAAWLVAAPPSGVSAAAAAGGLALAVAAWALTGVAARLHAGLRAEDLRALLAVHHVRTAVWSAHAALAAALLV